MPFLSRVAELTRDYRAAKAGVAILTGASALAPLAANAQDANPPVQTAQVSPPVVKSFYVKPPMPLEPHCEIIKLVFEKVEVRGEHKKQIDVWTAGGCKGDVPVPDNNDQYNSKRFGAAARILQNGGKIVLTP